MEYVKIEIETYDRLIEKSNIYDVMFNKPGKSILISSYFAEGQRYKSFNFGFKTEKDITNNVYYYVETDMIRILRDKMDEINISREKLKKELKSKEVKIITLELKLTQVYKPEIKNWFKKMYEKFFM